MKYTKLYCVISVIAFQVFAAPISGEIANWKTFDATPTNSDMTTDSPTIGDGSTDNANGVSVGGLFGTVATPATVTLAVGETLTVSGSVTFTGGSDRTDQIRFAIFDDNGGFGSDSSTWTGGGFMMRIDNGFYNGRTDGIFGSSAANASRISPSNGSTITTSGTYEGDSVDPYTFSLSITRDTSTTVDLLGEFSGGPNPFSITVADNDVASTQDTYTAFGVLLGGSSALDQASFSNVSFAVIPEPSSLALLGLTGVALLLFRRKSS